MQQRISDWLRKSSVPQEKPKPEQQVTLVPSEESEQQPTPTATPDVNHEVDNNDDDRKEDRTETQAAPSSNVSIAWKSSHPPLKSNITLEPLDSFNLESFKRLNATLLPIPYPQKYYTELLSDPVSMSLTLVAIWHGPSSLLTPTLSTRPGQPLDTIASEAARKKQDSLATGRLVGGIRCRLLNSLHDRSAPQQQQPRSKDAASGPMLYISTLGVLSPYQGHGIATAMLDAVLAIAVRDYGVSEIGAHVWEANDAGKEWYARRGFVEGEVEAGYYRRLKPSGAVTVRMRVDDIEE